MEQTSSAYYTLPPAEKLRDIETKQNERAQAIKTRRAEELQRKTTEDQAGNNAESNAATLIQRNFRGYRDRRALDGYELSPSLRWIDAIKEARYQSVTSPRSRSEHASIAPTSNATRDRWRRAGAIAHRAGSDDTSEPDQEPMTDEQRKAVRERKKADKAQREKYAKVMGLEYFLEMVDQKHRYGSNLRRYHVEWKASSTLENFFHWLDYGEGKSLDLEDRPRKRLDTEMVRYLSRDERRKYLVRIDSQGGFVWAKDGRLITTSMEWKDSINGIVPVDDPTPTWREVTTGVKPEPSLSSDDDDLSDASSIGTGGQEDDSKYTNNELHNAKGVGKLPHVSVDAIKNHLLRQSTKTNTWIFVADTSMRLYMGIKQPGAFQHSSFLHGARVSAAGLVQIKGGQLRKLSPLSGHYAPAVRNFREFVHSLKAAGADLSQCSISRSYMTLLGLEGYLGAKRQAKSVGKGIGEFVDPEEKRRREEREMDGSASAAREREVLRLQREGEGRGRSVSLLLKRTLGGLLDVKDGAEGGGEQRRRREVK
ncbi:hypothetical protein LTR62_004263 [Meristemomyces frigidus]|uniref:IQ calmodulin-binding motif protein n=1 Tax=Meristemomyces frigidus TaxID=1508187 RepID=A0AAN7TFU2_9PEZI|nr:hypothetical protein LTR62_004263 [Meristemomyces frigidus]